MKPPSLVRKINRLWIAALFSAVALEAAPAQQRPGGNNTNIDNNGPGNRPGANNEERQPAAIPGNRRSRRNVNSSRHPDLDEIRINLNRDVRSIDGSGNNLENPDWGAAGHPFRRAMTAQYANGTDSPAGPNRPTPRAVSNAISAQSESVPNARGASDFLWQWGQFLDHDIDETPAADPEEAFDIEVPAGDPWFDPTNTGSVTIPLNRSAYDDIEGVRQQVNEISAYIDASNVYGSHDERAFELRTLDGTGRLKVTETEVGDLLPYNTAGLANAPTSLAPNFFLAGDVRANEQIALLAMHTLFVREHNHWADAYAAVNPRARGEEIYQFARMIVAAEMQAITYNEFLPVLVGEDALSPYRGYNPRVDASISNVFATAAYRLGHSLLSPTLLRLDADGSEAAEGNITLASAFFTPSEIENHGIDTVLRGLANQACQELDNLIIDEVRNFLFGPPGSGGFDLASLNLQRGRDHGLPGLNGARRELGLQPARRFVDITSDPDVVASLRSVYGNPGQVDLWVGGLCEDNVRGSMLGPVLQRILVDQFTRLRDGDRFWYERHLSPPLIDLVNRQTLSVILRRNTGIGREIQDNVFLIDLQSAPPAARPRPPGRNPTTPQTNQPPRRR
ncbi:MAG: peroxidase family protein [Verrucomicrobiota bacterium]